MKNKLVGIKEFQAKIADSFPQKGEVTVITKRGIPTYAISQFSQANYSLQENVCPTCGQTIEGVKKNEDTD